MGWWMASLLTATVVTGALPIVVFLWPAPPKDQKKGKIKVQLTKSIDERRRIEDGGAGCLRVRRARQQKDDREDRQGAAGARTHASNQGCAAAGAAAGGGSSVFSMCCRSNASFRMRRS